MKFVFFLAIICAALETYLENSISLCQTHLQSITADLSNNFRAKIFDDNCDLTNAEIDICFDLLYLSECGECMKNVPKRIVLCKNCYSNKISSQNCKNCQKLIGLMKKMEILNLCLNKFIIKRYSRGTIIYFFENIKSTFSGTLLLFFISEFPFDSFEMSVLAEEFKKSVKNFDLSIADEIKVLDICAKYNSHLENIDCSILFEKLVQKDVSFLRKYLICIAKKFDFNFYNELSSRSLFKLIRSVLYLKTKLNAQECSIFIRDVILKTVYLGFIMDVDDFYELIDFVIVKNFEHFNYMLYFFQKKPYLELFSEEKLLLLLMKILKIRSIKSICPIKNLRIFSNQVKISKYGTKKEISADHNSGNNVDSQNSGSSGYDTEDFEDSKIRLTYTNILIEIVLKNYSKFTPSGLVNIVCIIFSFLNPENKRKNDFKDMLYIFYSEQRFNNFTVEHILDIFDLHLKYNVPYDFTKPTVQPILTNIKSGSELDRIFDHVFNASNKDIVLGVFVIMHDIKQLSESRLDQLIEYLINNLLEKTKEFFGSVQKKGPLSTNFQIKYIKKMINQSKIKNFDFFECISEGTFEHFSKNELDLVFRFCQKHKKYKIITKFVEYLDFNQLKEIEKQDMSYFVKIITKYIEIEDRKIARYLETPFFYYNFSKLIDSFIILLEKEQALYIKILFESILKHSLFQKCVNDSQNSHSIHDTIFENKYVDDIVMCIITRFECHFKVCRCLYESLDLEFKIIFKAVLIKNILFIHDKEIKNERSLCIFEEISFTKDLLIRCINIPQELKKEKVDFFLKNFDRHLYNLASIKLLEYFKKLILELDLDYLIEVYNKAKPRSCFLLSLIKSVV